MYLIFCWTHFYHVIQNGVLPQKVHSEVFIYKLYFACEIFVSVMCLLSDLVIWIILVILVN